jgi:magnesium-transporting ATPase (P-type)
MLLNFKKKAMPILKIESVTIYLIKLITKILSSITRDMNKKPSNKAMNNKIFLGLWFILFAALILLVNWLFRIPVLKTDNLMDRLADTDKQITNSTRIKKIFLLVQLNSM